MERKSVLWKPILFVCMVILFIFVVVMGVVIFRKRDKMESQRQTTTASETVVSRQSVLLSEDQKTGFIYGSWGDGYDESAGERNSLGPDCGVVLEYLDCPTVEKLVFGKMATVTVYESNVDSDSAQQKNPFSGCPKLKEIEVEEGSNLLQAKDGLLFKLGSDGKTPCGVEACLPDTEGKVSLPEGVRYINGFHGCTQITSLEIPSTVSTICAGALENMKNCENFFVDKENLYYCDVDGVIYTKDKKQLVAYPAGKKDKKHKGE
ncbi:MAG: hypothetical protein J5988_09830 [Eubacterium sp.]|nr:hypothetical protein [Eubacterium sp.]